MVLQDCGLFCFYFPFLLCCSDQGECCELELTNIHCKSVHNCLCQRRSLQWGQQCCGARLTSCSLLQLSSQWAKCMCGAEFQYQLKCILGEIVTSLTTSSSATCQQRASEVDLGLILSGVAAYKNIKVERLNTAKVEKNPKQKHGSTFSP